MCGEIITTIPREIKKLSVKRITPLRF